MKTLYLDCFCGISGDMTIGALLDLGVSFEGLRDVIASMNISGFELAVERVKKKGIEATQFHVHLDPDTRQPHRHLHHVLDILGGGAFSAKVLEAASETFRRIAVAEAKVHGTTIEKVHFHEVGAIDSIVDVVGAHWCLEALGVDHVLCSPLHVGGGTVHCAHGLMPVPAPATVLLLEGAQWYGSEVQMELVTPTGAALAVQLAERFGPPPVIRTHSVGYGSGTRSLDDRPNVLRVLLGETAESAGHHETITIVEANLDDMTPEMLAPLAEDLMLAGARDVFFTATTGKKGRPAHQVTVLSDAASLDAIVRGLFAGSTTFGLRMRTEDRVCLDRIWRTASTPWGSVRIKEGQLDGALIRRSPEFEDCRALAREHAVPVLDVYEAALAAAVRGEFIDA